MVDMEHLAPVPNRPRDSLNRYEPVHEPAGDGNESDNPFDLDSEASEDPFDLGGGDDLDDLDGRDSDDESSDSDDGHLPKRARIEL